MSTAPTASPITLDRWEKSSNLAALAALASSGQVTIRPNELIRTTDGNRVYHWTGTTLDIISAPVHHGTVANPAALDGIYLLPSTRGVHPGDTAFVTSAGCEYRVTSGINATATWSACATIPTSAGAIGADPAGTASDAVSEHNGATNSHADIRELIEDKQDQLTISPVGTALLNISPPAAQKIPRINPDASITLIDVPSGGGGTVFSPAALVGLTAWFKADSGVLKADGSTAGNGDSVATWQDQSGGGFHLAQGDGAKQPVLTPSAIGAYAALRFDAGARYMLTTTGPSMDLSELTIAVAFRSLSSEPYQRLVVLGPTGSTGEDWDSPTRCMVTLADGGNCADFYANSTGVTIAGSRPPPPGVLIARISRGRMVLIADDVVRSSVASVSSLSTSVGLLLGAYYASGAISPSYGLDGYIAEVALFSRALSDFECGQLSNYLARWLH